MGHRLGIIAGSGDSPFLLLKEAQKLGYTCAVAGIKGESEIGLEEKADKFELFDVDEFLNLISFFKNNGVKEAVFAGKVNHRIIYKKEKLGKSSGGLLASGKDKSPVEIIKIVIDFMNKEGIQIKDPTLFISSFLCEEGILTKARPSPEVEEDIIFGWRVARNIADLDIGQTVIVKEKAVVAVEGIEGTNEAIKRGGRLAGEGTVVVKVSRSFQDFRIDLPAVGLNTVKSLIKAKSKALCFEARKVCLFQKDEAISLANANKVSIVVKK